VSIALYVHFPFCLSICPYCDFDRQAHGFPLIDAYLGALLREIDDWADQTRALHSVFFGGGTPSLMRPDQVARVLDAAAGAFDLLPGAEVTLECNPGDVDLETLRALRGAGITRLSIGVQSLDDAYLARLGRRHSAAEARQVAIWARAAAFPHGFSLDFMYGLPDQTVAHWAATLDGALALGPDHLSCYLLTLEPHVPMGRDLAAGRITLPEDDALAEMYELTRARLAAAGYEQYELSNWARPGRGCRHNLTYWRDGEWLGVGAGAASALGGRRWKNAPNVRRYMAGVVDNGQAPRAEDERPEPAVRLLDHLTLGLRLREGVSLPEVQGRFGVELLAALGDEGAWLLDSGVLELDGDRLRVGAEHQLITNEVLVRLRETVLTAARL
jgi:oxygen-independent coproporphyrinogen III oxidase